MFFLLWAIANGNSNRLAAKQEASIAETCHISHCSAWLLCDFKLQSRWDTCSPPRIWVIARMGNGCRERGLIQRGKDYLTAGLHERVLVRPIEFTVAVEPQNQSAHIFF